jgi:hypothetical protein
MDHRPDHRVNMVTDSTETCKADVSVSFIRDDT